MEPPGRAIESEGPTARSIVRYKTIDPISIQQSEDNVLRDRHFDCPFQGPLKFSFRASGEAAPYSVLA